jgi:hypothetical protein
MFCIQQLSAMPLNVTHVKVATFHICRDPNCIVLPLTHLVVGFKTIRRSHGHVVAISYTWREFDRRQVVIGHDQQKELIEMCLGVLKVQSLYHMTAHL